MAMRFSRLGIRKQVAVVLLGKLFTDGMDFSNDRIVLHCSSIHGRASISSKGVTNSGSLYPLAAHHRQLRRIGNVGAVPRQKHIHLMIYRTSN
jgi:hypothetical protein